MRMLAKRRSLLIIEINKAIPVIPVATGCTTRARDNGTIPEGRAEGSGINEPKKTYSSVMFGKPIWEPFRTEVIPNLGVATIRTAITVTNCDPREIWKAKEFRPRTYV